jgi:hypothetical protein
MPPFQFPDNRFALWVPIGFNAEDQVAAPVLSGGGTAQLGATMASQNRDGARSPPLGAVSNDNAGGLDHPDE